MQQAEHTIIELSDLTEQIASGIGDVDLPRYRTALDASFTLLHGVLQKKACFDILSCSSVFKFLIVRGLFDYKIRILGPRRICHAPLWASKKSCHNSKVLSCGSKEDRPASNLKKCFAGG